MEPSGRELPRVVRKIHRMVSRADFFLDHTVDSCGVSVTVMSADYRVTDFLVLISSWADVYNLSWSAIEETQPLVE